MADRNEVDADEKRNLKSKRDAEDAAGNQKFSAVSSFSGLTFSNACVTIEA